MDMKESKFDPKLTDYCMNREDYILFCILLLENHSLYILKLEYKCSQRADCLDNIQGSHSSLDLNIENMTNHSLSIVCHQNNSHLCMHNIRSLTRQNMNHNFDHNLYSQKSRYIFL